MRSVFAKGSKRTVEQLLRLRRMAQKDKAPRVVLRIQGIMMSLDGSTTTQIADRLKVHRSTVPLWIEHWNEHGEEGLWEGQRSGRPAEVDESMRRRVCDILDSGPVAYGLDTGIWTSPIIGQILQEECGVRYHPGHVRKLLKRWGYSVQRPTTRLVQADVAQRRKWVRYTYPNLKKTPKSKAR